MAERYRPLSYLCWSKGQVRRWIRYAPEDDFLARNGLKYGQLYGFATDMSETGPTAGVWRDEWHKTAKNGDVVEGKMIAQPWRWDGEVKNFENDGKSFCIPLY